MRTGKATARKTEPEEFAYALPGGPMFWQAEAWVLHSGFLLQTPNHPLQANPKRQNSSQEATFIGKL